MRCQNVLLGDWDEDTELQHNRKFLPSRHVGERRLPIPRKFEYDYAPITPLQNRFGEFKLGIFNWRLTQSSMMLTSSVVKASGARMPGQGSGRHGEPKVQELLAMQRWATSNALGRT